MRNFKINKNNNKTRTCFYVCPFTNERFIRTKKMIQARNKLLLHVLTLFIKKNKKQSI